MLKNALYLKYNTEKYPFTKILESEVFKIRPLSNLHTYIFLYKKNKSMFPVQLEYKDNLALRKIMQDLSNDSNFYKVYHKFIREMIAPLYGHKISYSNHPKMRVHLAGTDSVSKWHRDVDITGREDQINVFLPFTDCFGTNTLWCESNYGLKDYRPLNIPNGTALLFDGGYLEHGTVFNNTNVSRVSLDFRFAPKVMEGFGKWSLILSGRQSSDTLKGLR